MKLPEYIQTISEGGPSFLIHCLMGSINIRRLPSAMRGYVNHNAGCAYQYRYFWFATEVGLVVAVSGDRKAIEALDDFFSTPQPTYEDSELQYKGNGPKAFLRVLNSFRRCYMGLNRQRSYGGSVLPKDETA
ncbi:hypothetical protein PS726_05737 [Pseudomonas fluorescens]|uniref:hypothetical protein n=1 Tax=Pseudomonas TaxID=286 RepID=UPI0012406D4C|nr:MULTISPECIES: hypothetical protein [Pseudomonas]NWF13511.1 hypothetical protein [Pseudomonas reactans]VVO40211.1 hypothetical protein PS726_05737 [Pseudomonas fluorescens]